MPRLSGKIPNPPKAFRPRHVEPLLGGGGGADGGGGGGGILGLFGSILPVAGFVLGAYNLIRGSYRNKGRVEDQAERSRTVKAPSTRNSVPVVYGTARVPAQIVDFRETTITNVDYPNYDATETYGAGDIVEHNGSEWVALGDTTGAEPNAENSAIWRWLYTPVSNERALSAVFSLAHGSRNGHGIDGLNWVLFGDNRAIGGIRPANSPQLEFVLGDYKDIAIGEGVLGKTQWLAWGYHSGTANQAADTGLTDRFPGVWTEDHRARNIAYLVLLLAYNKDVYPSGFPTVSAIIRGQRVYDPRNPTVGPNRDGYVFSDNPALCILDYMTSNAYGCGIPYEDIDEQSFMDMASYYNTLVPVPGGDEIKLHTLNGMVDPERSREENLRAMLTSCRGEIILQGGKYRLFSRQTSSLSGVKFNYSNIKDVVQVTRSGSSSVHNRIEATFRDKDENWNSSTVYWPYSATEGSPLLEDAGVDNVERIELPFTDTEYGALNIAQIRLAEQRADERVVVVTNRETMEAQVGSIVELTEPALEYDNEPFWVQGIAFTEDGNVTYSLAQYNRAAYTLDSLDPRRTSGPTDVVDIYDVEEVTGFRLVADASTSIPIGEVDEDTGVDDRTTDNIPRILATWTGPDHNFIDHYEIQYKLKTADPGEYEVAGRPDRGIKRLGIYPVVANQTYTVRIRAINSYFVASDWVEQDIRVRTDQLSAIGTFRLDRDGLKLNLLPQYNIARSFKWAINTGTTATPSPAAVTRAQVQAGSCSTTNDELLIHTFTAGTSQIVKVGVLFYRDTACSVSEGPLLTGVFTYEPGSEAENKPIVTWSKTQPSGRNPERKEAFILTARHNAENVNVAIYYRVFNANTPEISRGVFSRRPRVGSDPANPDFSDGDPHSVYVDVTRPNPGAVDKVLEFYAEGSDGSESDKHTIIVDDNLIPSIRGDITVDPITGQGKLIVESNDGDTGSYRGRVAVANAGTDSYPDISTFATHTLEFSGNRTVGGESGGGRMGTQFDLPGDTLDAGQAYYVTLVGLNTNSVARSAQETATRSPFVHLSATLEGGGVVRPIVTWVPTTPKGTDPSGKEAFILSAIHPTSDIDVAIYYRDYLDGSTPGTFTRNPLVGTDPTDPDFSDNRPHNVHVEVNRPTGTTNRIIEFYAQGSDESESRRHTIVVDSNLIPSVRGSIVVDSRNGQGQLLVESNDGDTGSYRGRVAIGRTGASPPPYPDLGTFNRHALEFSGSRTATGESNGGRIGTAFNLPGNRPGLGQSYYVTLVGLNTTSTAVADQASATRSPEYHITAPYVNVPDYDWRFFTLSMQPTSFDPFSVAGGRDPYINFYFSFLWDQTPDAANVNFTMQVSPNASFTTSNPSLLLNETANTGDFAANFVGRTVRLSPVETYSGGIIHVRILVGGSPVLTERKDVPIVQRRIYRGTSLPASAPVGALGILTS